MPAFCPRRFGSIMRRCKTHPLIATAAVLAVFEAIEPRLMLAAAAQAYDWRNVTMKGTGFINGVVFSPAAPNLMYANTDMGGAYRWDAAVSKWVPLTDWI